MRDPGKAGKKGNWSGHVEAEQDWEVGLFLPTSAWKMHAWPLGLRWKLLLWGHRPSLAHRLHSLALSGPWPPPGTSGASSPKQLSVRPGPPGEGTGSDLGLCVACRCPVTFSLEQFLTCSLFSMILIPWKNAGQLFCSLSLSLGLSTVPQGLNSDYTFLARIPQEL